MVDRNTGAEEFVQKIRGITFDVENSKRLKFEEFVEKVRNFGADDEEAAVFRYQKIQPTKKAEIVTRAQNKRYLPVCQKGIINENLDVFPFGYE